jgi:hypothetical protein
VTIQPKDIQVSQSASQLVSQSVSQMPSFRHDVLCFGVALPAVASSWLRVTMLSILPCFLRTTPAASFTPLHTPHGVSVWCLMETDHGLCTCSPVPRVLAQLARRIRGERS